MGPAVENSGGSAANTIVGVAGFGARAAFVGKVKDDELGRAFAHDIRAAGVAFDTPPATDGPSTARCYVMVTPDGERTMNTYLGAAQDLHPADVDADAIAASAITYLEGYLWDPPHAKEAFRKAAKIAHERRPQGGADAVGCVLRRPLSRRVPRPDQDRHGRSGVRQRERAEEPLRDRRFRHRGRRRCAATRRLAVVTRSEKGCVVVSKDDMIAVPAAPIAKLVDATGAGDLFAAGFLFGLARGRDHRTAAQLGALAAAEVIQHIGARPEVSLKDAGPAERPAGLRLAGLRINGLVSKSRLPVGKSTNRGPRPWPAQGYASGYLGGTRAADQARRG